MKQTGILKPTAIAAVTYFLCVGLAVAIDLGIFHVTNMAHTPALAALFAGGVYVTLVQKTQTFGPITVLGVMMSFFFFASGHFVWAFLPSLVCALVGDLIAKQGNYQNKGMLLTSYAVFSLGNLAPIVTMWMAPKAYAAQLLAEGKDQAYVDKVMIPAEPLVMVGHIVAVVICAALSFSLFNRLIKK